MKSHHLGAPIKLHQHPLHYPHGTLFMAPGPAGQTMSVPEDPNIRNVMVREFHNYFIAHQTLNFNYEASPTSPVGRALLWWNEKWEPHREAAAQLKALDDGEEVIEDDGGAAGDDDDDLGLCASTLCPGAGLFATAVKAISGSHRLLGMHLNLCSTPQLAVCWLCSTQQQKCHMPGMLLISSFHSQRTLACSDDAPAPSKAKAPVDEEKPAQKPQDKSKDKGKSKKGNGRGKAADSGIDDSDLVADASAAVRAHATQQRVRGARAGTAFGSATAARMRPPPPLRLPQLQLPQLPQWQPPQLPQLQLPRLQMPQVQPPQLPQLRLPRLPPPKQALREMRDRVEQPFQGFVRGLHEALEKAQSEWRR